MEFKNRYSKFQMNFTYVSESFEILDTKINRIDRLLLIDFFEKMFFQNSSEVIIKYYYYDSKIFVEQQIGSIKFENLITYISL